MENPADTPSLTGDVNENDQQNQDIMQNTQQNDSEYAEKPPLIKPKTLKLIVLGFVGFVIVIIALVVVAGIIKSITEREPPNFGNNPIVPPDPEPEIDVNLPKLAYIKDLRDLWIVDINGEAKERVIELSPTGTRFFTVLTWKNNENITYSKCGGSENEVGKCIVESLKIDDKSIETLIPNTGDIRAMTWSPNEKYFGYITNENGTSQFKFKSGTIDSTLTATLEGTDLSRTKSKVIFTPDNNHIIYSAPIAIEYETDRETVREEFPVIYIYQVNGVKVDEIINASDPMIFEDNTIIYKKDGQLMKRTIGNNDEAGFTVMDGFNAEISPEKSQIAYWRTEGNLSNIVLGVFDADLNIHRNILRGVLMPKWLTENKVAGIKADNCLGSNCQLYEFKTNSLVIVDIKGGNVIPVDQGKKISSVAFQNRQDDSE